MAEPRYDPAFTAGVWRSVMGAGGLVWPREKGSWAQLVVPMLAALILTRAAPAALLMALAAAAAFMSHEPFMVISGLRGPRARFSHGPRAWRQLAVAPLIGVAAVVAAGVLGAPGTSVALLIPVIPGVLFVPLMFGRLERTAEGELLATVALVGFSYPAAVAGGASLAHAAVVTLSFMATMVVATMAVRRVTATAHGAMTRGKLLAPLILLTATLMGFGAAAWLGFAPWLAFWAQWPVGMFSLFITARPPHLRYIRTVGWTLTVCTFAALVLILLAVAEQIP